MANFTPTSSAEALTGTVGAVDTALYNFNATGGLTVDVVNGGTGDIAEGDTYTSIERFFLGNLSGEVDVFIGSSADEYVNGLAGPNFLNGEGGNDTIVGGAERNVINGGTGVDLMFGQGGDDRFDVAAGDVESGERFVGRGGTDTIRLIDGGTGSQVFLNNALLRDIEHIEFDANVTLRMNSVQLTGLTVSGTLANTGEFVRINDWNETLGNVDLGVAFDMIDSGVDGVRWRDGSVGQVLLTEELVDVTTGDRAYVVTTTFNSGSVSEEAVFYNMSGDIFREVTTQADGLLVTEEFDPANGDLLEVTSFDLSAGSTAYDYEFKFVGYDGAGNISYEIVQFDDDRLVDTTYTDGIKMGELVTDNSSDGTSFTYQSIETIYTLDGFGGSYMSYREIIMDAGQQDSSIEEYFDESGTSVLQIIYRSNGNVGITGSADDQTFVATDADEAFGGGGGDDTFVFSGDIGTTFILDFDAGDALDLTAYGVDSRDDLEAAGALTYNAAADRFIIDMADIGGTGTLIMTNMQDADLGNDDFILV